MKTTMQKAGHSDILKSQAFEIPPVPIDQNESLGEIPLFNLFNFFRCSFVCSFVRSTCAGFRTLCSKRLLAENWREW